MSFIEANNELIEYLSNYKIGNDIKTKEPNNTIKKSFKKFYPILLIQRNIDRSGPWKGKDKSDTFNIYLKETISDLIQALIISAQGIYKPGHLSLRSALENFVRCIGISQDQKVLSLTSVYELLDLVRDTPFISADEESKKSFSQIRSEYSKLCGFVHTSGSSHMSLTTLVGAFPRYLKKDADVFFNQFTKISSLILEFLVILFPKNFRSLHHKHYDIVCDALPLRFKRLINI